MIYYHGFSLARGCTYCLDKEYFIKGWGVIPLYLLVAYIYSRLLYASYKYQLTGDTLKIERGVIWKHYSSIPHERIQNIDIHRGVVARLLGLSDLHIQTAGYSGYGGRPTEGYLPGLDPKVSEQLREDLIKKVRGTKQGF